VPNEGEKSLAALRVGEYPETRLICHRQLATEISPWQQLAILLGFGGIPKFPAKLFGP
jgi:hypothetical protein